MMDLSTTTGFFGVGMALVILFLVRRDHIFILQALFWLMAAVIAALFGLWPSLITHIAQVLGIFYPPAALLLGAVVVLTIKALLSDMSQTRLERQVRRLNQRIAILETQQNEQ